MPKTQQIESINVSIGKKAHQSSLSPASKPGEASMALTAMPSRNFAFETDGKDFPFWQVDLEKSYPLEEIVVHNRRDDFQHRACQLIVETSLNRRDWTVIHQGLLYWDGPLRFPLSGNVKAQYVRLRLNERLRLHLDKVEVFARHYIDLNGQAFVALRNDGLGERLNAILNGLWLSEIFDCQFKFTWPTRLIGDADHAITQADETFHPDFLAQHLVADKDVKGAWELAGPARAIPDVAARLARSGLIAAPRLDLQDIMAQAPETDDRTGLQRAFSRIQFAPDVARIIRLAKDAAIPEDAVALHLRSGDIFFGPYRKLLHYTYKGVVMPLAKAVVEKYRKEGRDVYLFGQDKDAISILCQNDGVFDASTIHADEQTNMTAVQSALYDLTLLSRFNLIVGGTSGFSKQACWIGGGTFLQAHKLFPAKQQTLQIYADLAKNEKKYDPLQVSFAYWYGYTYGRQSRSPKENVDLLQHAIRWDPDNELYHFVLAAVHANTDDSAKADRVLSALFADRLQQGKLAEVFEIFTAKTGAQFNIKEYLPAFETLAKTSFFAALLMAARHKEDGKSAETFITLAHSLTNDTKVQQDSLAYWSDHK